MGVVVNATPQLRYPREREPGTPCIGGWVAPETVWMGAVNLAPPQGFDPPDRPSNTDCALAAPQF